MRQAEDIELVTPLGRRAGLHWRTENAPRVLCLHGWLDNAASFIPLAPLLDKLEVFALDFPGHGNSEHRHMTARYHFIDYLWDVDAVLNALQWEDCHLLGHSLGAAVSSVYCAGAPERVRSAVLLDTLGPISVSAQSSADRLRRSLHKNRMERRVPRKYRSIDEMAAARRKDSDLSVAAARLICERSARKAGAHYEWISDPALNWISSLVMTDEQALDFLQHIEAPVLSLIASPEAPWCSAEKMKARRQAIAHGRHETVTGHHHFHMDEPEQIAETIQSFILASDKATDTRGQNDQTD
jgi:pimeloyl-ACP methyl ester carboxylesterase